MATKRPVRRISNEDQPLRELFEEFQARNRYKNLTQSTLDNYAHTFEQLIDFVGEDATGKEIFEKTIINFVNMLKERDIKPASINHYLRGLRAFLYWCMDSGYIVRFKVLLMREQEVVKETYTPEELQVLLREPKPKDSYVEWRSWAVINWMLDNGNRAQTVCSVRMMDFTLEGQYVTLSHTKNRKAQILPISDDLAMVLRKFIRMFRSDAKEDEYLFPNVDGNQMTPNGLKLSIRKYNLWNAHHPKWHGPRHHQKSE